jgi:hypothetical protein
MSLSRRHFVHVASLSVLAHTVAPAVLAQTGRVLKNNPFSDQAVDALAGLTAADFEPYIGDSFAVAVPKKGTYSLTLISVETVVPAEPVTPRKPRVSGPLPDFSQKLTNCFTLQFESPAAPLPQGTYTLTNSSFGSFPLFLVPSAEGIEPSTCTAVFNLLR